MICYRGLVQNLTAFVRDELASSDYYVIVRKGYCCSYDTIHHTVP